MNEETKALADALGYVVADLRKTWRLELSAMAADSRTIVAELKGQIADLHSQLRERVDGEIARVKEAMALVRDGDPGPQGDVGPSGPQGEVGPPGKDGSNGIDGKDGAPGPDGKDGSNGLDGKDGANGIDGKDGANGIDGKDGAPGPDGKDGANGLDGKDGANGLDGKDGANGLDGKDGSPGENGRDGLDGKDGANGLDGKDGSNGFDGAPGRDGESVDIATTRAAIVEEMKACLPSYLEEVATKAAALVPDPQPGPQGEPGDSVSIESVSDLVSAIVSDYLRGKAITDALVSGDGDLVVVFDDGRVKNVGPRFAKDINADSLRGMLSDVAANLHKGIWEQRGYQKGDWTTYGGSMFIARKETTERPTASEDWQLVLKRGRDGKDAEAAQKKPQAVAPIQVQPND